MIRILHQLRNYILVFVITLIASAGSKASTGDTLLVHGFDHLLHQNCNTGDSTFLFPPDSLSFYKIMLRYELSCPPGGCDIYDRIATLKVKKHTGRIDSTLAVAPSYKVNGQSPDSLQYMNDTSYSYSYDTTAHQIDSVPLASITVILYDDAIHPFDPTDTLHVWPSYYNQYQFDANGIATDSVFVTPDSVLYLTVDSIYTPFEVIDPFEIARAITPYGEGVVLWFDVSDYRTLLHDSVELFSQVCGYSNGWHVTTDFYFIEGIAPMHPFKVTNLWNGTFPYGNTSNPIDSHLQPITLIVDSQSVYERVRLITSGHGFGGYPNQNVAEFYDVTHSLIINGTNRTQHLWRPDCGRNPLYPQGAPGYTSTWFLNRANWCPGSYVGPHDYNATPLMTSGDSLTVDYNMASYTVTGGPSGFYAPEYYIQSQAIYFDDIHYVNNAALLEVRRPNGAFEYNRSNPICQGFNPEIVIKNYGADTLQELTVHYGIDGNYSYSYSWTGNLLLSDTTTVTLPQMTFGTGSHTFNAYIDQPNNSADEFAYDDTMHTSFNAPTGYNDAYLLIWIKLDNSPGEASWEVRDDQGTLIAQRSNFVTALATYKDTVFLSNGCYNVTVRDAGGDGVCCYNGPAGFFRVYVGPPATNIVDVKDYGEFYSRHFIIDDHLSIEAPETDQQIFVYPNPATNTLILNTSFENAHVSIELLDLSGRKVSETISADVFANRTQINLPHLSDGMYYLRVEKEGTVFVKKLFVRN